MYDTIIYLFIYFPFIILAQKERANIKLNIWVEQNILRWENELLRSYHIFAQVFFACGTFGILIKNNKI